MGTRRISVWIRRRFGSRRSAVRGVDIMFLFFLAFVIVTAFVAWESRGVKR